MSKVASIPPAAAPLTPLKVPLLSTTAPPSSESLPPLPISRCRSPVASFQERLVGVGRITAAGSPTKRSSSSMRAERESFVWGARAPADSTSASPEPPGGELTGVLGGGHTRSPGEAIVGAIERLVRRAASL